MVLSDRHFSLKRKEALRPEAAVRQKARLTFGSLRPSEMSSPTCTARPIDRLRSRRVYSFSIGAILMSSFLRPTASNCTSAIDFAP